MKAAPTITTMFLRHILGEDLMINKGLLNFYLGEGREFYAVVEKGSYADTFISGHPFFKHRRDGDVLTLEITDDVLYSEVYLPFKQGKYSKVSRKYVEQHFPSLRSDGTPSSIRKIFDKDQDAKVALEKSFAFRPPSLSELEIFLEEKGIPEEGRVRYRRLFRSSMETFSRTLSPVLPESAEIYSRPTKGEYMNIQ